MKRYAIGIVGSFVLAAAVIAAQEPASPAPSVSSDQSRPAAQPKQPADLSVTGCLIQGSGPNVFLLEKAKHSVTDKAEKGQTYKLASATEDLNFQRHLNHEVTISGSSDNKMTPSSPAKADEKDLPTLSAKSLSMVADKCTAPTQ